VGVFCFCTDAFHGVVGQREMTQGHQMQVSDDSDPGLHLVPAAPGLPRGSHVPEEWQIRWERLGNIILEAEDFLRMIDKAMREEAKTVQRRKVAEPSK
jgi:hypothetical protein